MVHCRLTSRAAVLAGGLVVLALAATACDRPASPKAGAQAAGPLALSREDLGMLERAKASGVWKGDAMPGLTLEQTRRQVVYEAKISAVIQKLMSDPSRLSKNEFGSMVVNTDAAADLPTILGEAGFKDYMANNSTINRHADRLK